MQLSKKDRWILSNQHAILQKLYPEEASFHERAREILENGWELEYKGISQNIYEETMSEEECLEVIEILAMFNDISSWQETNKTKIDNLNFQGFNGNNEVDRLSYARYLIGKEGYFIHLKELKDLNSHMPVSDMYRRMLSEWKKLKVNNLTEEDLVRFSEARAHPSNRE